MKPLSRQDADLFEGCVADALSEVPDGVGMVIAGQEEGGAILASVGSDDDAAAMAAVDQLVASRPPALAAALRLHWARLEEEPTEPAWVLITIVPGRSAKVLVKRDTEERWWRLKMTEVPWIVLSTAGSLRAALEEGKPMTLKSTTERHLFRRPDEGPTPPTDERGFL